jgi:hypothetical protein
VGTFVGSTGIYGVSWSVRRIKSILIQLHVFLVGKRKLKQPKRSAGRHRFAYLPFGAKESSAAAAQLLILNLR